MYKKIIICFVLFHLTSKMNAQFFRGAGFFIGGTMASDKYKNDNALDNLHSHAFPAPTHRSGELLGFSVGIFGEFLKYQHVRWQTEFEYCTKGGIESVSAFPGTGIRLDATANVFKNIQWNNFLKVFGNYGRRGIPYFMVGARLGYNFGRRITAYPAVTLLYPKLTLTPDVGVGYEFNSRRRWRLFTELHYNPDAVGFVVAPVVYWQRMFEVRVGLIYRPKGKSIDDCNAPRYHGSSY